MKFENIKTFCNPLSIPDIPWGRDAWFAKEPGMFSHENKPDNIYEPDYRSISDPTVFYWENKWYLYPSYGMAWVSEDFCTWKHIPTEPYCPKYSPSIVPWKNKFLLVSWNNPLYVSDTPTGPFELLGNFIMPDGTEFVPCDPAIFSDDDGRIYLYAFFAEPIAESRFFKSQIVGYELDIENPRKVIRGPEVILEMNPKYPWERSGCSNQNMHFGWCEGPHMLKHQGRYYMIYAAPNTEFENYCMAVAYSDESPLSGFVRQKQNPLTIHKTGIVRGCGHGCVEHGPNNTLWAFYTVAVPYLHMYERRIGMNLVEVDENGELYCPYGITDVPTIAPGNKNEGKPSEYHVLNTWCRPTASSNSEGRNAIYACDGSALTWWQPAKEDREPLLICDLYDPYQVGAIRIFWRDIGLDYKDGIRPGPFRYIVEGCSDDEQKEWFVLCDRRDSNEELNIDYRTFEERSCRFVRLKIAEAPKGITPGVIDFSVFGYME